MSMSTTKKRSTIVIIDHAAGQSRSLHVGAAHVRRAKHYILLLAILLIGLICTSAQLYMHHSQQQQEQHALRAQIRALQAQIPTTTDTISAQTYIQRIESKLEKINTYLKKRGVKGFTTDAVGGYEAGAPTLSPTEYYSLYDQRLERMFEGLTVTPMGYPGRPTLTSGFGYRSNPFHSGSGEFHSGLDFRGNKGDAARATASGRIVSAGWNGGYGNCVQIRHANGYETLYGHLSKISVQVGQQVQAGQTVGLIGSTGRSTGSHLHYEVRKNNKPVNPTDFLTFK